MADKKPVKRVAKAGPDVKGGKFKGKDSINLSKKELGKKGAAAATKRTVNISNTKYDATAKKVMGPAGKPLTGKVDMGGGNMAVYKDGKRVTSRTVKKATPPRGGGVTSAQAKTKAKSSSTKPTSDKPKAKAAAVKKAKIMADKAKGQTPRPKPLIRDPSKDSTKPRSSYDAQGKLYHEMFYLGQWRRVKQNSDGKWMPTAS